MANTIEVFVPIAEPKIKKLGVNARVPNLNRKVLGFLWNEKPNGDVLLQRLKERLTQKFQLASTEWAQIGGLHVEVEKEPVLKQLACKADTVVIAVCD